MSYDVMPQLPHVEEVLILKRVPKRKVLAPPQKAYLIFSLPVLRVAVLSSYVLSQLFPAHHSL
jgi:hypothetical protein